VRQFEDLLRMFPAGKPVKRVGPEQQRQGLVAVASDLEQAVDGVGRAGTVDLESIQRQLGVFG
jgi:hypothetical protein